MKTVFRSSELPHLWAHNLSRDARCPSAESISGDSYYSYGTVIGRRYEEKGKVCFIVNETSYSSSTSKHQSAVRRAIPGEYFRIGNIQRGNTLNFGTFKQTGVRLFEYAVQQAAESAKCVKNARRATTKDWHQTCQTNWLKDAVRINEFFGLRRKVDEKTIERLREAQERVEAKEKKVEAERQAARVIEDKEEIALWLSGGDVHLSYSLPCYLRTEMKGAPALLSGYTNRQIVTSKGARISYEAGKRTFEFCLKVRTKGWHTNGHKFAIDSYELSAVNEQGIVAGCHRISWEEIERFAKQEGWI